jgi:TatD DNase family protein
MMMPLLVDTHVHFDDISFAADRTLVWQRAQSAGVKIQIIPAVTASAWAHLAAVCTQFSELYPAFGLHPLYLAEHKTEHLKKLLHWLQQDNVVAIGECGLDYFVDGLDRKLQLAFFSEQLQLAQQFDLPVIIHARRAVDDVIQCLRHYPCRGVVHSFSGSEQQANQLLNLGFYLSFGGPLTYPRANRLRHLVQILPLEWILLETDAPDQPLSTHRGERNEPCYLPEIAMTLAELRQESPEHIAAVTTQNALTLFGLSI